MAEIRDSEGRPVVPTMVPPETVFPYQDQHAKGESIELSANISSEVALESKPSIPHRETEGVIKTDVPMHRELKRAGTAPILGIEATVPTRARTDNLLLKKRSIYSRQLKPRLDLRTDIRRGYTYDLGNYSDEEDDSSSSSSEDDNEEFLDPQYKAKSHTVGPEERKRHGKCTKVTAAPKKAYSRFSIGNDLFWTKGKVSKRDGRLNISVKETADSGYLAKALGSSLKKRIQHCGNKESDDEKTLAPATDEDEEVRSLIDFADLSEPRPKLNIAVIVIGSRGDIQPFIRIGKILQDYGHRVRIATHPAFREFVERDSGLEFFSVGGDPSELMAFMVKNPGLVPSVETIREGEIGRRRAAMFEMFGGMWRACINATDDETDRENMKMMGDKDPFIANAIIANPPSFAHIHIAEALGIPLHIMFTFPYTPTTQFPHPLANIKSTNTDSNYTNFMSYPLVEMMTWQGLGDLVNRFRVETLKLEPVSTLWAPGQLYRLKVPHTYMWSPSLVSKPLDWGPEIDIAGFVFLDLASSFQPSKDLLEFLDYGPPPVYIGFGSIVVDDPNAFTKMIFEAVKLAGVRALVSKGWGGLGGDELDIPENVFLLDNTPHDWLFPRVAAVVHHGGAGTTAIGLKCGCPTMIVPFFGDQPFWGTMVAKAKAGAHECIPFKKLNAERLAEGIKQCLTNEAKENVKRIAIAIEKEGDGALNAVHSFLRNIPIHGEHSMKCSILEDRTAVWRLKHTSLRLSALAAELLIEKRRIKWSDLRLLRHCEWNDFQGGGEPITAVTGTVAGTIADATLGVGLVPINMVQRIKKRHNHSKKKRRALKDRENVSEENATNGSPTDGKLKSAEGHDGSRPQNCNRKASALSLDPSEPIIEELAKTAGHGLVQTGRAISKAPMDLSVAVAQGFHNAPRLYGDTTVRTPRRITGLRSGILAGRDEFIYGIYDGVTGLLRHPYRGIKEKSPLNFAKGLGFGVGGLFLKTTAAGIGPFAYTLKGVEKELQKKHQPTNFIRRAHIIAGRKDRRALSSLPANEQKHIIEIVDHGWDIVSTLLELYRHQMQKGISGRLKARRRKKEWEDMGALESTMTAEKALKARMKGINPREVLMAERLKKKEGNKSKEEAIKDREIKYHSGQRNED